MPRPKLEEFLRENLKDTAKLRDKNTKLFVGRLARFLDKKIPKLLDIDEMGALEAFSVIGGLQRGLEAEGLGEVVSGIQTAYADELTQLSKRFKIGAINKAFSSTDRAVVDELINFDTVKVTNILSTYVDDVSSVVFRSIVAGEAPDVSSLAGTATETIERQLTTEVDTLLSGFSRAVSANKANELALNLFLYVGPDDKVTRPFCQHVLDRDPAIYTREEIAELNSHEDAPEGLDVLIYGGGYNCRHQWAAVSEDLAKEMGWE